MTYPSHPFADLFPMIDGPDFDRLVEDIRAHGLIEPVVLLDGKILDGRNRARACEVIGIEPVTRAFDGNDPLQFVLSLNLRRRHLTASQRALIAARLETLRQGKTKENAGKQAKLPVSRDDAAAALNVSRRSVTDAKKVMTDAAKPVAAAVERGDLAVDVAAKLTAMPKPAQTAILKRAKTDGGIDGRRVGQEIKRAARAARERELGARQQALPDRPYGVVYADPPWRFKPFSDDTGMDRAADNHYPTQPLDVIKGHRPVTADDAVLFLWATAPMLVEALEVMAAWGFAYKSHAIWDKVKAGTGYWFRSQHEVLLVGTKGNPPAPADVPPSLFSERATRHSAKPAIFREIIGDLFETLPKLEMYCRDPAPGWDVWGFEADGGGG